MVEILDGGRFHKYKSIYIVINTNGYSCSEPLYVSSNKKDAEDYMERNYCSKVVEMPDMAEEITCVTF